MSTRMLTAFTIDLSELLRALKSSISDKREIRSFFFIASSAFFKHDLETYSASLSFFLCKRLKAQHY